MAIRKKGRAQFNYNGRQFVWYVHREIYLRIASVDKQFSVTYELIGNTPLMGVTGPEFIGLPNTVRRPALIVPPPFSAEMGGRTVRQILDWCFDPNHVIAPYDGPPGGTVQRAWASFEAVESPLPKCDDGAIGSPQEGSRDSPTFPGRAK